MPPKKKKGAAKKKALSAPDVQWEWKDDDGTWNDFAAEDADMLQSHWEKDETQEFATSDFSFNTKHNTVYKISFVAMTQTNAETGAARAMRSANEVSGSKKKKTKTSAMEWFWQDDEDEWQAFSAADAKMLEDEYLERGPKAKFKTKKFSFNKGHDTNYEICFETMYQKNMSSKNRRTIRRGEGAPAASPIKKTTKKGKVTQKGVVWECWLKEEKTWQKYEDADAELLEAAFGSGSKIFCTKNLTWNKGYDSEYVFDFIVMSQMNNDSGTSRKIRRSGGDGDDTTGDDGHGYAAALSGAIKKGKVSSVASTSSSYEAEYVSSVSPALATKQKKIGPQSLRGGQSTDYGPAVSKDKHGSKCFDEMLKNEKTFCGEWAVFYHSYSVAALLYEVQAAVAAVLFRFKSDFATLPRLLWAPFEHIPTAGRMLEEFPTWKDRDHNAAFRGVGLCGVSSLLAGDSEAPPKSVFLAGYSVGPLGGLLESLLEACGVPKAKVKALAKDVVKAANDHGLDASAFGGKCCSSGRAGHYLQMFIRRDLVDKYVYPSFAYGVPDKKRGIPPKQFSKYLEGDVKQPDACNQIRITANPDIFLRATCVRMFVFSADPSFHAQRKSFQKKLTDALRPILATTEARTKAAHGIWGDTLPDWWTPEDQSEESKMTASRYGAAVF